MLLDIVKQDVQMRKATASEWHGPCPICGGNDRFVVFTKEDRFWCRAGDSGGNGCGKKGDAIEYLRLVRGMTFQEAKALVGKDIPHRHKEIKIAPPAWKTEKKIVVIGKVQQKEEAPYETKLHTLPLEQKTDETIAPVEPVKPDPIIDVVEAETIPGNNGDTVNVRPRAQYFFASDIKDIERFGCKDCDYRYELSCAGGKTPGLIGLMETCPRDGIRG